MPSAVLCCAPLYNYPNLASETSERTLCDREEFLGFPLRELETEERTVGSRADQVRIHKWDGIKGWVGGSQKEMVGSIPGKENRMKKGTETRKILLNPFKANTANNPIRINPIYLAPHNSSINTNRPFLTTLM